MLTLRFWATGATPAEAGRRLAARTDSLRRALGAVGIPRDSVVNGSRWYWWQGRIQPIVSQRCEPWPDRRGCTQVSDTTYRAHETVTARIRDLDQVGPAIDTALAHDITDMQGPQFAVTDASAARGEALREATADARRQAEVIAEAGGVRLGRLISLGTSNDRGEYSDARAYVLGAIASSGADPGTSLVAPSVTISITVFGRWEVEQPRR